VLFRVYRVDRRQCVLGVAVVVVIVLCIYIALNIRDLFLLRWSKSVALQFARSWQQQFGPTATQRLEWQLAHSRQFYDSYPQQLTDSIKAYLQYQPEPYPATCVLPDMYYDLHDTVRAVLMLIWTHD
jgi:hypothetical protein